MLNLVNALTSSINAVNNLKTVRIVKTWEIHRYLRECRSILKPENLQVSVLQHACPKYVISYTTQKIE